MDMSLNEIHDIKHEVTNTRSDINKAILVLGEATSRLSHLEKRITGFAISKTLDNEQQLQ